MIAHSADILKFYFLLLCISGYNTEDYNSIKKDILIYKVKVMEEIPLDDSDEESTIEHEEDLEEDVDKICEEIKRSVGIGQEDPDEVCEETNEPVKNQNLSSVDSGEHEQFIVKKIPSPPRLKPTTSTELNSKKVADSEAITKEIKIIVQEHLKSYKIFEEDLKDKETAVPKIEARNLLPYQKEKAAEAKEISTRLQNVVDPDSDEEDPPLGVQLVTNSEAVNDSTLEKSDDFECVPTRNPLKMMIRRKSVFDPEIASVSHQVESKVDLNEQDKSKDLAPQEKLSRSVQAVKKNCPPKPMVTIIEPHTISRNYRASKPIGLSQKIPQSGKTRQKEETPKTDSLRKQPTPTKEERSEKLRKVAEQQQKLANTD